jgi:nicotinamidase-related amidase
MTATLRFGPIGASARHLCIDMQRLFAEATPWTTPWMVKVLPRVVALAEAQTAATVFTRFLPPPSPEWAGGAWRRYFRHWSELTASRLDLDMVDLVPDLAQLAPPAMVFDKFVYSPWFDGRLHALFRRQRVDTVVITGAETEVCVAAAVLGAVDLGYRVIVVSDAVCSSADSTHDAMVDIYHQRFGLQIEVADTETVLAAWPLRVTPISAVR